MISQQCPHSPWGMPRARRDLATPGGWTDHGWGRGSPHTAGQTAPSLQILCPVNEGKWNFSDKITVSGRVFTRGTFLQRHHWIRSFYLKSVPSKLLCRRSVALGNGVIRNQDVCQWPLLILISIMMVRPGAQEHQEDAVTEWLRERACEFMTDAVHSAVPAELLISSLLSCFPHFLIFSELTENYWQSIDNNYCEMCLLSDKRKTWNKYLTC